MKVWRDPLIKLQIQYPLSADNSSNYPANDLLRFYLYPRGIRTKHGVHIIKDGVVIMINNAILIRGKIQTQELNFSLAYNSNSCHVTRD
jgi:hypothetical protein